jgi:hypothetical protein
MAPFKSTKSDEQRRKDTIVMITAIMFVGLLMSGILGYKINAVENIDTAELQKQNRVDNGKPQKNEPNPWAM